MTTTQRAITGTLFILVSVLVALIVSLAMPVLDVQAGNSGATITTEVTNFNLPMMTEDRYAPNNESTLITIVEMLIPAMLPPTSGQCGEDSGITC